MMADTSASLMFFVLLTTSAVNHLLITNIHPQPYMDEIFHVPQTQEYCKGNYDKWDNKITTLPGLYIFPTLLSFLPFYDCSVSLLRLVNLVYTLFIFWIFYDLIGVERPEMKKKKRAFMAYTLTLFPVNYFFTFLYYTDQQSTLLVLLMLLFSRKNSLMSAVAGALAVITRQTNVIWVMWTTIVISWDLMKNSLPKFIRAVIVQLRTSAPASRPAITTRQGQRRPLKLKYNLFESCIVFGSEAVIKLAPKVMPFALVMLSFLLFVIINQGVVVGDRSAHEASINLPQLFYFSFFVGFMLSPLMIIYGSPPTLRQIRKHWKFFFSIILLGLIIVHLNTVVHQYLLADNRHYTFYIWKRFYEWYPITRYLLVPCYVVVWFWIWSTIELDPVLLLGFLICLAANVVPQKLLEYRYFIVPFYIIRMKLNYTEWKHLIPECLLYFTINIFTIYLFIMAPFGDPYSISRFMW